MYIGLDIGTSGMKAGCYDARGALLRQKVVSYPVLSAQPGYRELDVKQLYQAALTCLAAVSEGQPQIKTISISSLGEAIVVLGKNYEPLTNVILGTDIRGTEEFQKLGSRVRLSDLTEITRVAPGPLFSLNKILWLQKHRPALYAKATHICTVQDYLAYRLSGVFAIDYSMASRTMLFDAVHRRYASSLLNLFDIDASLLSKPYAAGSAVGTLKRDVAEKLHISAAAKVVLGTHDHICNAIGSGVIETGWCSNTCGTTEGLSAITPMPESSAVIEQNGISFEPFDDQPHYITVAWSNTSGAMYRWLTELLAAEDSGCLARWTEELSAKPDEISRLLVLPYFAGAATPYMDARAKGAICGLTLDTKPAEIFGAMVEASCFEMKRILATLEQAGVAPEHIVSTGAAATPFVSERKAAILGKPVQLVGSRQTGTLGGAMLGMLSEGEYASLTEAAGVCVEKGRLYTADPALSARYHDRYQLYSQLYTQLKQINHGLL